MIANIDSRPFANDGLNNKISYHEKKMEKGFATLLDSSFGSNSLDEFKRDCLMIKQMNDRVKYPFNEVSLNLPSGEKVSDELLVSLANEYMSLLGYKNSNYAVIKHSDKDHLHVHVLFTTLDKEGKRIKDSNIWYRSQRISRVLEQKYNLSETEYKKFETKNLTEINSRKCFFDVAFKKALKDDALRNIFSPLLEGTLYDKLPKGKSFDNMAYEKILGDDVYKEIGDILTEKGFLKPLYKDELIAKLEEAYKVAETVSEFKELLKERGCYMRMVTDKGSSRYIYGLADASMYFKDKSLPLKFRFGNLNLKTDNHLSVDEQKNIIYNQAFKVLSQAKDYNEFVDLMYAQNIRVIESSNSGGIYGLSFALTNVKELKLFKASDISRKLSYSSIDNYFSNKNLDKPIAQSKNSIFTFPQFHEKIKEISEPIAPFQTMCNQDDKDDNINSKKKKRRQNGMIR